MKIGPFRLHLYLELSGNRPYRLVGFSVRFGWDADNGRSVHGWRRYFSIKKELAEWDAKKEKK